MNDEIFWELQRTLSGEFSKYVLTHPDIDEHIPDKALIVFNLENNPEFNDWAGRIAYSRKEPDQPVLIVKVKELSPVPISRLVNPELEIVDSI